MRKKFTQISMISCLVLSSMLTVQAQFQKTLDITGGDDYANVVTQDPNGGNYIVGSTNATGGGAYDAYIAKLDNTGSPLWEKQYGGANTEFGTFVMYTTDGNLLMVGRSNSYSASQDMFVVKTDLTGAVLWAKTFGTDSVDYGFRATENASGYLIVGQTKGAPNATNGKSDILMVFVGFDGTVKWTKTLGTPYANEVGYDVKSIGSQGFAIAGYTGVNLIGLNDAVAFILDTAGNLQGGFISGGQGDDDYRTIVGTNNAVYFIGNTYGTNGGNNAEFMVAKYNTSGQFPVIQWLKSYGGPQNESLTSATMIPDGSNGIILMGHTNSFGTGGDGIVMLIDSDGALIMSKTFGGTSDDYINNAVLGNSGALFVGNTTSFGGAQSNIYLVAPDQTGTTPCNNGVATPTVTNMTDTSIGPVLADFATDTIVLNITNQTLTAHTNTPTLTVQCETTSVKEIASKLEFGLYPNPTSNRTELVLFSDKNSTATVTVCNALGQTLKGLNTELATGKNSISIDVNGFAAGIYYVKVTTADAEGVMPLSVN